MPSLCRADKKALKLILENLSSNPPASNVLCIASFDFSIIYRSGLGNMADYLSRHPMAISPNQSTPIDRDS